MKHFFTILTVICLLLTNCTFAESVPEIKGLTCTEGNITGKIDTIYGFQLQVDMPMPDDNRYNIRQYKMQSRSMTVKDLKKLLSGKIMTGAPDVKWEYRGSDGEGTLFNFHDEHIRYTWLYTHKIFCPINEENTSEILLNTEKKALSVLDSMNISYEYPLYCVTEAYRTMNTKLYPSTNVASLNEATQMMLSGSEKAGKYSYTVANEMCGFDDEYIYVLARLQADGIPFAVFDIVSPEYQSDNPIYDMGAYVEFQMTSDGEITYAKAGNIQDIVMQAPENRPILSWQTCLNALCTKSGTKAENSLGGLESAMLVREELCYAINQKHVTYPVWEFTIEIHYPGVDELPDSAYAIRCYVDAITGECL